MTQIDINCDVGEGYGPYNFGADKVLIPLVSRCNIACGFHAGDPNSISQAIELALKYEVQIGAHPSFPDRQGFGRRNMAVPLSDLQEMLRYQIGAVKAMTESKGGELTHVKPHGALYTKVCQDLSMAEVLVKVILEIDPKLGVLGLPDSILETTARLKGLKFWREGFLDRQYQENLTLVPRANPDALLLDQAALEERLVKLIFEKQIKTVEGNWKTLEIDTLCVHGDSPGIGQRLKELALFAHQNKIVFRA